MTLPGFFNGMFHMLYSSSWIALLAAFLWGLASVVFSPCHLMSIPLLVGYLNAGRRKSQAQAFVLSLLFAAVILITIGIIGVITGLTGRILGDLGGYGTYVVSGLLILFGLYLTGLIPLPLLSSSISSGAQRKGLLAVLIIAITLGIALGPCTFAFMAPLIGLAFRSASKDLSYSIALFAAFALGHCLVIVLAGTFSELARHYLNWDQKSKGSVWAKRICGALVMAGGIYLLITA